MFGNSVDNSVETWFTKDMEDTTTQTTREVAMSHSIVITIKAADGSGNVDGWKSTCSCGDVASFSVESMTHEYAASHKAYMAKKEAK